MVNAIREMALTEGHSASYSWPGYAMAEAGGAVDDGVALTYLLK